eukprot:9324480-Pyramimonas_sp.AAC.1
MAARWSILACQSSASTGCFRCQQTKSKRANEGQKGRLAKLPRARRFFVRFYNFSPRRATYVRLPRCV